MKMYERMKAVNYAQKRSEAEANGSNYLPDENIKKRRSQRDFKRNWFSGLSGGRRNFLEILFGFLSAEAINYRESRTL